MNTYIHIPFCRQKCPYCKFALTPIFNDAKKQRYIGYLSKEIRDFFAQNPTSIDTIYFGGGTPSALTLPEVRSILSAFPDHTTAKEISFECNSEDLSKEYILGLIECGITRISIGVQSLSDATLREVHRSPALTIYSALRDIQDIIHTQNIPLSVNVDFIIGLPYTKYRDTLLGIQKLHADFPCITHTSVYLLEDEKYPPHWKEHSISEKEMQHEYIKIIDYFESIWWHHYEVSNFAQPGYESLHNSWYWDHTPYRGFWLSASSFMYNTRWSNSASFSGYYRGEVIHKEILSQKELDIESFMFGLRTSGIHISENIDATSIQKLTEQHMIHVQNDKISVTKT